MQRTLTLVLLLVVSQMYAQQGTTHQHGRAIQFPDLPDYQTLSCDFHIHSVFSDGSVWPNIRVQEALKDSLDAISLTEHLEYQPHGADIPHPDRNRAYEIATQEAKAYGLLIVNGAEITRDLPPGHTNAIFVKDANKLLIQDSVEVFREAKRQGAFTFWNHANWIAQQRDGIATLTEMHKFLIAEGLLDGIEVVNDVTYSDEALQIALDNNLAIIGTSDIHGLVDWQYNIPEGGHRPVTLVFAKERSEASIKEALEARRTVAWYNNNLIGREEWLLPLIQASLTVEKAEYEGISSVLNVHLRNHSDSEFHLMNRSFYTLHRNTDIVSVPPHETLVIQVKTREHLEDLELRFTVLNAVTAPQTHPDLTLEVQVTK